MQDDDLEREIRSHLEREIEEQRERGLSEDEARHAAYRAFGNATRVKEELREMWGWVFLDRLKQDVAYALRGMRRNPGFTIAAVVSLALGIGANTAIFTLINAVMLRSLPVPNPQELVQLTMQGLAPEPVEAFAYPMVQALADHREVFSHLGGFASARLIVGGDRSAEVIRGAWVTGDYYQTLEVQPQAGRLIMPSDDRPGAPLVAVITDGYWARKYARNPLAIGQSILIEGKPPTIVGVTPPGFNGADVGAIEDMAVPIGIIGQLQTSWTSQLYANSWWIRILARPQSGISPKQVKARLDVIWRSMPELIPRSMPGARDRVGKATIEVRAGAAGASDLRRNFYQPLMVLMAVTGLLLLIACANVANLLLARATARRREIGVRMAIGAGRGRVVRQLLTESVLLSLIGAALGVALAWIGSRGLVSLISSGTVRAVTLDVAPDLRVLSFTCTMAIVTGILFGLAPAFQGTAAGPAVALRDKISGARTSAARLLVTVQLSLTLLLLIGAGLFIGTLRNLQNIDAGFRMSGVFLFDAEGMHSGYTGDRAATLYENLQEKIQGVPGVVSASYAMLTPLSGGVVSFPVAVNGVSMGPEGIPLNRVSRRYFETMGTPVVIGREFTSRDRADSQPVAIVNELFARRFLPGGGPLGKRLTIGSDKHEYEVIGVVRDSVYETLRKAAPPTVFVPVSQSATQGGYVFEVRAGGSLTQVASTIRNAVQPILPGTPVRVRTLTWQAESSLVRERLMATLAGTFGVLGLSLAVVGLYGLLAYTFTRRTNEIGVRMALGATQENVLWMVVRSAMVLLGIAVAIGLPAAWAMSRLVSSTLFGLTATDPSTIAAATGVLLVAGILADSRLRGGHRTSIP